MLTLSLQVLRLEMERRQQEEEVLLWRMQFAELQAAGVLSGVVLDGPNSVWARLLEMDAAPTDA